MTGPTRSAMLQPRLRALQFRLARAIHRDIQYASRLVTRIQTLAERADSPELKNIALTLRTTLLQETSQAS